MVLYYETPVAFPGIRHDDASGSGAVYVVNDHHGTIRRLEEPHTNCTNTTIATNGGYGEEGMVLELEGDSSFAAAVAVAGTGMSSVSELFVGSGSAVIVTTSPVSHQRMAVTVLNYCAATGATAADENGDSSPRVAILDFNLECRLEPIVAVQAFHCPGGSNSNTNTNRVVFQLVVVDSAGSVVTTRWTLDSLTPVAVPRWNQVPCDVRCCRIPQLAAAAASSGMRSSSSSSPNLTSTMVAFVTSDVLVVALNPYLVAVDLFRDQIHIWSQIQCLQEEKIRASVWKNLVNKSVEFIVGGGGKEDVIVVDMKPVAAVCTVDNDPRTVFTLHADGTMRHWTLPSMISDNANTITTGGQYLLLAPYTVRNVPRVEEHIPESFLWSSDAPNTTYLTARLLFQDPEPSVYAVCLHVQTVKAIEHQSYSPAELDMSSKNYSPVASKHVIVAIDVPADVTDEAMYASSTHLIPVHVPIDAKSSCLVDMQLDPRSDRCKLLALFRSFDDSGLSEVVLCSYSQCTLSMLGLEPVVVNRDMMLDGAASRERDCIAALSFASVVLQGSSQTQESLLDDALFAMNQRFMRFLFRPSTPRGNGTVLPPRPMHIRRAMQRLQPQQEHALSFRGSLDTDSSIEEEVAMFVDGWRKLARRQHFTMQSPVKKFLESPLPTTARTALGHFSGASLYNDMDLDDDLSTHETPVVEDDDWEEGNEDEIQQALKDHEDRWKVLLLTIVKQEESDRMPLALFVSSAESMFADAAIIVRPSCICSLIVIKPEVYTSQEQRMATMDETAMQVLNAMMRDKHCALSLVKVEQFIQESITQGAVAINPDVVEGFKLMMMNVVACISDETASILNELTSVRNDQWNALFGCAPFRSFLPGLCALAGVYEDFGAASQTSIQPSLQSRLAAGSLVVNSIDSLRRLLLARCLIALSIDLDPLTQTTALRMYLHSVALISVMAEIVPMHSLTAIGNLDSTLKQFSIDPSFDTNSSLSIAPPKKRAKVSWYLGTYGEEDETVILDALLIQRSHRRFSNDSFRSSVSVFPLQLGKVILTSIFQFGQPRQSSQRMPELNVLPECAGEITEPHLALRLLSLPLALPNHEDSTETMATRTEIVAQCLVSLSRFKPSTVAVTMVARALDLLPFDEQDLTISKKHLRLLESRMRENVVGGEMFLQYIRHRIEKCLLVSTDESRDTIETLLSALFNSALSIKNWTEAYSAVLNYPIAERRLEKYTRLVRAMVDHGALRVLLDMCSELSLKGEAVQHALYFPDIVADALTDMAMTDIYTSLVVDPEPPSDYQNALFDLHMSLGQYKKAAQVMDIRYVNSQKALSSHVPELDLDQQLRRQALIVDDMVRSSRSCYNAMKLEPDSNAKYLMSGERGLATDIPFRLRGEGGSLKHGRNENVQPLNKGPSTKPGKYMRLVHLEGRAVRVKALKTLFDEETRDSFFVLNALANEGGDAGRNDSEIRDELFASGYYAVGLNVARTMDKIRGCLPNGRSLWFDSVSHLICNYLLPFALDKEWEPSRPTFTQIEAAIKSFNPQQKTTLLAGSRYNKLCDTERSNNRMGTMLLVRELTTKYSSVSEPLAEEVAKFFLRPNRAASRLPHWLEDLLLTGTVFDDLPGLFARRRMKNTPAGYLGNPVALLQLYTMSGLFKDACRIVTLVLSRNDFRKHAAHDRLPEKGELDFVPEHKIEFLWNLIEGRLNKNAFASSNDEREQLLQARSAMDEALVTYFTQLQQISEIGIQSARTLAGASNFIRPQGQWVAP